MSTCGDFGGVKPDGTPCGRPRSDGLCHDHDDEALSKLQALKSDFLEALENGTGTLQATAQSIGLDQSTVWHYRQADEIFDRQVSEVMVSRDRRRLEEHADSLYARILRGEVAAVLEIFWMVNTARRVAQATGGGMRWQDLKRIEVAGDEDSPIEVVVTRRVVTHDAAP